MNKSGLTKIIAAGSKNIVLPITKIRNVEIIAKIRNCEIIAKIRNINIKHLIEHTCLKTGARLKSIPWQSRKVWGPALMLLMAVAGTGVYLNTTVSAAIIYINGHQIGIVSSVDQGKQLVEEVLKKEGQTIGQTARTHDQIDYRGTRLKKAAINSGYLSESDISNNLKTYIDGVELNIAGENVAILPSQDDVQKTLKAFQDYYNKPTDSNVIDSVSFAEEISTEQIEAQPKEVQTADMVLDKLIKGKTASTDYMVKDTDSWWQIARNNNMLIKDVLACNPGTTEKTALRPGQNIKIASSAPYLTVISKGVLTLTQAIPFEVQNVTDDSLSEGKQVVQQEGSDGLKQITTAYTQKNGTLIEKQVLDEHITKQPVTRIVAKAPSMPVYSIASSRGTARISGLSWPVRGYISSPFGYRSQGFHTGIDIVAGIGTAFTASASGTIAEASYSGGYGKMILINHGNGVMTRYAHASKLMVSAGQHVNKGQTIGLVGTTGNSTGPHLHFEVIINGNTVNPRSNLP